MAAEPRELLAASLGVSREQLARMLVEYGENDLAGRALSFSDDEMARIGTLGAYYAFSEDAIAVGGSMGGARALALATVDVVDRSGRNLRPHHNSDRDVCWGFSEQPSEADTAGDRELRSHAQQRQIPADETKRILDILDPPAWGPAPPDATPERKRCHELRTKPLKQFTAGDLRFMIERQVSLNRLVGRAINRLRTDPLLKAEDHPGDLLTSVLGVDAAFWEPQFDLEVEARKIAEHLRGQPEMQPGLRKLINTFIREHPQRSTDHIPGRMSRSL